MIQFAEAYPDREIVVSLLRKLGWTQFLRLIRSDDLRKHDYCTVNVWREERGESMNAAGKRA